MSVAAYQRKGRTGFLIAFLGPAVVLYFGFVIWPLIQAFQIGTQSWSGLSDVRSSVGVQNFVNLAKDDVFHRSLMHSSAFLVLGLLGCLGLGLGIAYALQGPSRGAKFVRAIYLFPQVISMVVVAIIWRFFVHPTLGLLPAAATKVGVTLPESGLLGSPTTAFAMVFTAFLWHGLGFYVMLFGAGLQGIDSEVVEAAELDGSVGWHRFQRIGWPLLWSIRRVAAVYVVSNVMNLFALVLIMTTGGPDRATEVLLTYLYELGFKNFQFGTATALAVINFVFAMLLSGLVMLLMGKNPVEPASRGRA